MPERYAERRSVGSHVGAALVDDGDHADRRANTGDIEAVRAVPTVHFGAQRVRNGRDSIETSGHGLDAIFVQQQPINHGIRHTRGLGVGDITRVCSEDRGGLGSHAPRHGGNRPRAGRRVRQAQCHGGLAAVVSHRAHLRLQARARVVHPRPICSD